MLTEVEWFRDLPAEDRAWVGQIVQAGIQSFVEWYEADVGTASELWSDSAVAASVFGVAPRALAGAISLHQTVDLVRLSIEVVEGNVDALIDPADAPDVHAAVLRYAREVAFAAAEVYARAAEVRGAWDARLEALVVDAVLPRRGRRDRAVASERPRLGRTRRGRRRPRQGPGAAHRDRPVRRRTPCGQERRVGRAVRGAGRSPRRCCSAASPTLGAPRIRWWRSSATGGW